jgi:hypothetical protein
MIRRGLLIKNDMRRDMLQYFTNKRTDCLCTHSTSHQRACLISRPSCEFLTVISSGTFFLVTVR